MAEVEQRMSASGFWSDQESAQKVVARLKILKGMITPVTALMSRVEDLQTLHELAVEGADEDGLRETVEEAEALAGDLERLELRTSGRR